MSTPRRRWSRWTILALLTVSLLPTVTIAAGLGAIPVPFGQVMRIVAARLPGVTLTPTWTEQEEAIILRIRLPRVANAMIVGYALAVAGVVFQGLLRNPLADPYIIGTSGGAALGATLALLVPVQVMWFGFTLTPLAAFVGALGAAFAVYAIARVGPRTPITTLLLAGFALSSLLAAAMSFLMFLSGETLQRVVLWTMGSVSAAGWKPLLVVAPLIFAASIAAYAQAGDLNAFLLGEDQAAYLGVDVERRKLLLLAVGSLLTGAAVSVSGLVGFVGLVIPHVARLLLGPDHRLLLPAAGLLGGFFLVAADLAARLVMAPTELPLGVVTAVVGAPFFLYLLRQSKRRYEF